MHRAATIALLGAPSVRLPRFYQRLGDDIATELVEWFNAVDATYRSDVRAIADAQSARIDAQMGQMRAELRQEIAGLGAELRQEIGESRSALHQEIGELRTETRAGFADLKAELLRWMFLFWVGTMGTVLALLKL